MGWCRPGRAAGAAASLWGCGSSSGFAAGGAGGARPNSASTRSPRIPADGKRLEWNETGGLLGRVAALGYMEGQNIELEVRYEGVDPGLLPALAAELVALPVDMIITSGELSIR